MPYVKAVIVGSTQSGKTCFSLQWTDNRFPDPSIPTVFDNYPVTKQMDGRTVDVCIWDTSTWSTSPIV